uniref:RNA-directed DNA polymerase n=1 Tax=Meloidogyne enterolobii TaxID=390850 RepID=A0A6V7TID2_MELEN|nr:unnamed protein product [Meloidogyne enterolobii]
MALLEEDFRNEDDLLEGEDVVLDDVDQNELIAESDAGKGGNNQNMENNKNRKNQNFKQRCGQSTNFQKTPHQFETQNQGYTAENQFIRGETFVRVPNQQVDLVRGPLQQFSTFNRLEAALILDKIPDIDGREGSDKIRAFFRRFDLGTEEWTDAQRIRALQSKVEGKAERALNAALDSEEINSFGSQSLYAFVKRKMIAILENLDAREAQAFDQLFTGLKRRQGENIDQLSERVYGVVRRAYPGLNQYLIDDYAIKHFLRALDCPDIALSLELSRTPNMSYDSFIALAARAEAAKNMIKHRPNNSGSTHQNFERQSHNYYRNEQNRALRIQQPFENQNARTALQWQENRNCYICGRQGHIATYCRERNPGTSNQASNWRNSGDTQGPNRQNKYLAITHNTSNQNRNYFGNNSNSNYQNRANTPNNNQRRTAQCVRLNEIVSEEIEKGKVASEKENAHKEIMRWINSIQEKKEEESTKLMPPKVGKLVNFDIFFNGQKATAIADGGAQVSLISAEFLAKILKEEKVTLTKENFCRDSMHIVDINGQSIRSYGVVSLPANRQNTLPVDISLHVSTAPFGSNVIVGTNALGALGFKMFDESNLTKIDFEHLDETEEEMTQVTAVFKTVLAPRSTTLVPVEINGKYLTGKEAILSSSEKENSEFHIEPGVISSAQATSTVPITNKLSIPLELNKGEGIGKLEVVKEVIEAENTLKLGNTAFVRALNLTSNEIHDRQNQIEQEAKQAIKSKDGESIRKLEEAIGVYSDIFALNDEELTQTDVVTHHVETSDAEPIKMRARPMPYALREKVAAMIQDYLARGIIRNSWSPWASPIVLVPKKDGTVRFCVDYRGLNSVTVKDAFPLPNIDNTLMMLGNKKVFSTMDFMTGYWQIRMDPDSIEKSAFATEKGLYEFLVMPFGMTNAVATFQRFMNRLFEGILNQFVFVYIDDILVASNSFEEHISHLKIIFERIREAGLKLKIKKCCFLAKELPFLGHILTQEGIKKDIDRVKPILEFPIPTTQKKLQSFLGFMTYYRKFIYEFGKIAAPLFRLLKKDNKIKIGEEEKEAFETLKKKIAENVVLYFPDFDAAQKDPKRMFIIMTDASKLGIAAVLCQPTLEGKIRPLYFASRQCNQAERKYAPTELEALAVKFGANKFAQFITMIPTRVLTDHRALVPMFKKKGETGNLRVDRWIMELQSKFILLLEYNPGKNNIVADVLSRNFPETPEAMDQIKVGMITQKEPEKESFVNREEWVEATEESEMRALVQFFKERILPDDPREKQQTLAYAPFYTLIEGLLFRCDQNTGNLHLFVPRKFRQKLIEERHSGVCAGHLSAKKIYMQLAEKYFWNNMRADCSHTVAKCRICAYTREPRSNQPGLKTVKTSEPLELVCLDVLEIGRSRAKNRYILVCVDHFSKWTVAEPIPNKMAETIARAFVENFILIYGAPKRIHSDRGKEFVNSTLENITKILKTEVSTTRGYDPQANGLVERMNHTIIRLLKRTTPSEWDWDIRLPYVVFAINATPSETTGFSPYTLMFGRTINFPTDKNISLGVDPRYTVDEETYLQLFRENLANIIGEARENTKIAQERQKIDFDKRPCVTEKKFIIGERVMVIYPSEAKKLTNKKLGWNHFGPFKILEVTESSAVLIPIDKPDADQITVPLERLIKIPTPGIPDISILPKKKAPFKHLFATLFILNEKEKTEKFKNFNLKLSETTNFLDEEEEDSSIIDWTKACQGEGHEECSPLEISELDPVLGRQTTLGTKIAKTPLQALLTTFILRQFSSSTAARRLTQTIIEGEPKEEFIMFIGGKGDLIPKDIFPIEEDLKMSLEAWIRNCNYSFQLLQQSEFSPIHIKIPIMPFTTQQQVEQKAWCDLFTLSNWILEEIRAKIIHRKQLITLPRVILGDSSAVQLTKEMTNIKVLTNEEEGLSGIIRAISSVILSSKVKGLLIVIGRDALIQNVNLETIQENFNRIREICSPYTHLQILWAIPPYIHSKKEEYEELIRLMPPLLAGTNIKLGLVGENGRSLGEVFRYGESFAGHRINKNGLMTEHGVKAMLAWIYSVGSFPGEKEEGRKRIHSRIVVVRPASETPIRRGERGSLGDRRRPTDPRSPIRRRQHRPGSSNYRSPVRTHPYKQGRSSVSWRR